MKTRITPYFKNLKRTEVYLFTFVYSFTNDIKLKFEQNRFSVFIPLVFVYKTDKHGKMNCVKRFGLIETYFCLRFLFTHFLGHEDKQL